MKEVVKQLPLIVWYETSEWCKLPYPRHPSGCPNFGKREDCPPKASKFWALIKAPYFLVGICFNLHQHIEKMRENHPDWSEAQLKCLLYWQNTVNKRLRQLGLKVASQIPNSMILFKPEANGVDVFKTAENVGIYLERNPQFFVWKIAIIGVKVK